MDPEPNAIKTWLQQPRMTRGTVITQSVLGLILYLLLAVPFLRRTHGLTRPRPRQPHLLVCNHISLLDSLLIAALCWRSGCYPILVLGDKNVWHASWVRRLLSCSTAFLLERSMSISPRSCNLLRHPYFKHLAFGLIGGMR